jgi:hypothetical protein
MAGPWGVSVLDRIILIILIWLIIMLLFDGGRDVCPTNGRVAVLIGNKWACVEGQR